MTSRSDNFTRANTTTGFGSPSDGGSAWTDAQGTSGITGNKGYFPTLVSSRGYSWLEANSNVGTVSLTDGGSGNTDTGLMLRYSDVNNFIELVQTNAGATLFKRVAGTFTTLASNTVAFVASATYTISVDASNVITCKVNGTNCFAPVTDSFNSTATKVGIRSALSSASFTNFSFTDAAPSSAALAGNATDVATATAAFAGGAAVLTGAATDIATATGSLVGVITCTDQTSNKIFQRIGTTKAITFSGTYPAAAGASVEVQLYAADGTTVLSAWAALTSATISGGTWSGTLNTPQGGMYRFAARFKDAGGIVIAQSPITTNLWGVGDLLLTIGSSSAVKYCDASSGTGFTANANIRSYDTTNAWNLAGTVGSMITVANNINNILSIPIGIVQAGVAGSKLSTWSDTTSFDYTNLRTKLTAIGGKLGLVCAILGSNDAASGIVVSEASHMAKWMAFIANIRSDVGQASLPFYVAGTNSRSGMDGTQADWVRQVEMDLELQANVYFACTNVDLEIDSADNIHLTVAGYTNSLARMALTHTDIIGSGTYHRGPKITSYTYTGLTATVNVQQVGGTNLTINAAHGFVATDGSGSLAVSTATVTTATMITVTFARSIVGILILKYVSGSRPIESTQGVHDNSTLALPLEVYAVPGGLYADAIDTVTANGSLNTQITLTGASIAVATATGLLAAPASLTGAALDLSTANGNLTAQIQLSGAALAQALASAGLTTGINLSGNATDIATSIANLATAIQLAGNATDVASANANLQTSINLAANALAQSFASAGLLTGISLSGNASDTVLATASITTQITLSGSASDVATATANFAALGAQLTAASTSNTAVTGALTTQIPLTGNALDIVTVTGAIVTQVQLTASAIVQALATGVFTTSIQLTANATDIATASGTLTNANVAVIVNSLFIVKCLSANYKVSSVSKNYKVAHVFST